MSQIYFLLKDYLKTLRLILGGLMVHGLAIVITTHQILAFANSSPNTTEQLKYRLKIACRMTKSIWRGSGEMTVSSLQNSFEIDPESPIEFILYDEVERNDEDNESIVYFLELKYIPSDHDPKTKDGILSLYFNGQILGDFNILRSRFKKAGFEKEVSYQSSASMLSRVASSLLGPNKKIKFRVDCDEVSGAWK